MTQGRNPPPFDPSRFPAGDARASTAASTVTNASDAAKPATPKEPEQKKRSSFVDPFSGETFVREDDSTVEKLQSTPITPIAPLPVTDETEERTQVRKKPPSAAQPAHTIDPDEIEEYASESLIESAPQLRSLSQHAPSIEAVKPQPSSTTETSDLTPLPGEDVPDLIRLMTGAAKAEDSLVETIASDPFQRTASSRSPEEPDNEGASLSKADSITETLPPRETVPIPEPHGLETEYISAPLPRRARSSGRSRWIALLFFSLLVVGGGIYGYFWLQTYRFVQSQWQEAYRGVYESTLEGYQRAQTAIEVIRTKRAKDAQVVAAQTFVQAALAIEFGEDRLTQAQTMLSSAPNTDSEWRTATQGLLSLIQDPTEATGYLRKGLEVYPQSAVLRYLEGRALTESAQYQAAVESFQAALKLSPTFVAAKIALAELIGHPAQGNDSVENALKLLNEVLDADPENARALMTRAKIVFETGTDFAQAEEDIQSVINLGRRADRHALGWSHLLLARFLERQLRRPYSKDEMTQQVARLMSTLDQVIQLAPCCDSRFFYESSLLLAQTVRLTDAISQIQRALALKPKEARYLHQIARIYLEMNQPHQAKPYIEQAPERDPETQFLNGRVLLSQQKTGEAQALFERLLEERYHPREVSEQLALVFARKNDVAKAEALLSPFLKDDQNAYLAHATLGAIYLLHHQLDKAELAYKEAWRNYKLDPRIVVHLGTVSLRQHDFARAEQRFNKALMFHPHFADAHLALVKLNLLKGDLKAARTHIESIQAPHQNNANHQLVLAALYVAEQNKEQARQALDRALATGISVADAEKVRGDLLLQDGKSTEAIRAYEKAVQAEPENAENHAALGIARFQTQKLDDAYDIFHRALQFDDAHPEALYYLGRIAIQDEEISTALTQLQKALESAKTRQRPAPMLSAIHTALARTFLIKNNSGQALAHLQDAIDLDPNAAEPHWVMGQTYEKLNHPARALNAYLEATRRDASFEEAYFRIATLYQKIGQQEQAKELLNSLLRQSSQDSTRKVKVEQWLKLLKLN